MTFGKFKEPVVLTNTIPVVPSKFLAMAEMSFAPTKMRRSSDKKDQNKILGMLGISDPFDFLKGCTAPSRAEDFVSEPEQVHFPQRPKKMLAAILKSYGPATNLEVKYCDLPQMPRGELGPFDVLVEIHAASVNPTDCKARKGTLSNICPLNLPTILGIDFSGKKVYQSFRTSGSTKK